MKETVFWILCAIVTAWATESLYEGFKAREASPGHHATVNLPSSAGYGRERSRPLVPLGR